MTPAQLAKLFQPFTQADAETSAKFGRTGLGLAITRKIAELLGGTVTVTSVLGAGSTFQLNIPLASAIDAAPPMAMAAWCTSTGMARRCCGGVVDRVA